MTDPKRDDDRQKKLVEMARRRAMTDPKIEANWLKLVETAFDYMRAERLELAEGSFANAVTMGRALGKTPAELRPIRLGLLAVLTKLTEES